MKPAMNRRSFCRAAAALGTVVLPPIAIARRVPASVPFVSLDGRPMIVPGSAIGALGDGLDGDLLLAGDPTYDSARRIWNSIHDKRPALIVRARSVEDVVATVRFARDHSLLLAVKGGGHSWPGKSVCDGGVMLDLGRLHSVDIDTRRRTATIGGGALLGQLDRVTLAAGHATTTGVVSHTGIGGYTLGGGYGRLNRSFGLAIDNLIGAEVVTADGAVHHASEDEEPDLFWALRGGGGNFGVVTRFRFRLHPFDRNVLCGVIRWPLGQARDVLRHYADTNESLPRELYVAPSMGTLPDGTAFVACEVVYAGRAAAGERALAALRGIGKPFEDDVRIRDYQDMQTMADGTFGHGIRSYAKNGMAAGFQHGLAEALVEAFRPDPRLAFFTHVAGGAVRDVPETATAYPHRNAALLLGVTGGWTDPEDDELAIEILRAWYGAIEPFTGGYYDNIASDTDNSEAQNYGPNYPRLQQVKSLYDPGNLFRLNSNVQPAEPRRL